MQENLHNEKPRRQEAMRSHAGASLPTAHPKAFTLRQSRFKPTRLAKWKEKGIEEAKINIKARKN